MADPTWESIISDPSFQAQSPKIKARVASNYYKDTILSDPSFTEQPIPIQAKVKSNFYQSAGLPAPKELREPTFAENHPNIASAIDAIKKTPGDIQRQLLHGATFGLSEKARTLGRKAAEAVTGSTIPDTDPYEKLAPTGRAVGEFVGSAVPIAGMFKVAEPVVGPVVKTVMRGSRHAPAVAKVATSAVVGPTYETIEKGINEGKLPTAGELGISAASWGTLSVLGMGAEYATSLNSLSKLWGMPIKEVHRVVSQEAKKAGLPPVEHVVAKSKVQRALKIASSPEASLEQKAAATTVISKAQTAAQAWKQKVDDLVNLNTPFEDWRQGTYQDLTGKMAAEEMAGKAAQAEGEAIGKVNSFGTLDRGVNLNQAGERVVPEPQRFAEEIPAISAKQRMDEILAKPQFQWSSEDRIFMKQNYRNPNIIDKSQASTPRETIKFNEKGEPINAQQTKEAPPLLNEKSIPTQKNGKLTPNTDAIPSTTLKSSIGSIAGIEQDEEGNLQYNVQKGIAGAAMGSVAFGAFRKGKGKSPAPEIDISKMSANEIAVREKLIKAASSQGQSLTEFMRKAGSKPEFIKQVQAYYDATKSNRLNATLQGKSEPIPELPKYARSVNLEKQNIPDSHKQFQAEMAAGLPPKKTQGWAETTRKAYEIMSDPDKAADVLKRARQGKALVAEEQEVARQTEVNAIDSYLEISKSATKEEASRKLQELQDNIFMATSEAASTAGRSMNALKKEIAVRRIGDALSKLKKGLNQRQFEELQKLNPDDPISVKHFTDNLEDPKLMDYVMSFWYNNILSGIPTQIQNVAGNTLFYSYQFPHRALVGTVDKLISPVLRKQREYFASEVIPMLAGTKSGFKKGKSGAWEMLKTGRLDNYESKWTREIGKSVAAFNNSPYKPLRAIAPIVEGPSRGMSAMDIWANSMAYDAELNAQLHKLGKLKGLRGQALKDFTDNMLLDPNKIPQRALERAAEFAKHTTFTDDPGWISAAFQKLRDAGFDTPVGKVQPFRFIVPFVQIVGNLMKRGLEFVPGVGVAMMTKKPMAEMMAKQIEGAMLASAVGYKIVRGEITGAAPKDKNEKDSWERQGKIPWGIKIGNNWYSYRRYEPFNTVIASTVNVLDKMQRGFAKGEDGLDLATGLVSDFVDNILDTSYTSGLANAIDKNRRGRVLPQIATGFIPFSSLSRSLNRAIEANEKGYSTLRDTKKFSDAAQQSIPFMFKNAPVQLNAFGEEKKLEGGPLRQLIPFKMSTETKDPVEKELSRLKYFPGLPDKYRKIGDQKLDIPDELYRKWVITVGKEAKQYYSEAINHPEYKSWTDTEKKNHLKSVFEEARNEYEDEVRAAAFLNTYNKANGRKRELMREAVENSKVSDELYGMIEEGLINMKPSRK